MIRSYKRVLRIRWAPRPAEGRAAFLVLALAACAAGVRAQEIEPRAYSNTPIGVNFLLAGYSYAEGGLVTDPALPLENANLQTHTSVLAYARSFEVGGQSGKDDFLGDKTREQDPICSVKGDLIYDFRNGIWVALNGTYFTGGRATVDGVEGDNLQKNSRGALRSRCRSTGTTRSSSTPPPAYPPGLVPIPTPSASRGSTAGEAGFRSCYKEDDVDDHPRVAHLRVHRKIDLRNSFREVVASQILKTDAPLHVARVA